MEVQENVAYIVLIIGSTLDQISTRIGLTYPYIYEVNPFTQWLQAKGLWLVFDTFILILLISPLSIILKENKAKELQVLLFIPMIIGFVRLIIGVSNLLLI